MGKILRVRDVMTADVVSVSHSDSVEEAARVLHVHKLSGAPVVEQLRVVGTVSTRALAGAAIEARAREHGRALSARDVMTPLTWTVFPGDAAILAVRLMLASRAHRAVVVDQQGRLLGIMTASDVLRGLAHEGARLEEWAEPTFHADPELGVGVEAELEAEAARGQEDWAA